jgi:carbonic anhydrase
VAERREQAQSVEFSGVAAMPLSLPRSRPIARWSFATCANAEHDESRPQSLPRALLAGNARPSDDPRDAASRHMTDPDRNWTADEALKRLRAGNERFAAGRAVFPTAPKGELASLVRSQRPYATLIGCSDSRVTPELVFDAGLGELFIVRVAGNVVSPEVMGSLQYAGVHLETPLFVVLGHEGCGAVQAALATLRGAAPERERIALLVERIAPGLARLDLSLAGEHLLSAAVEANVRWSMRQILDTPEGRARVEEGVVRLVGAVYDLATGRVRFLSWPEPDVRATAP